MWWLRLIIASSMAMSLWMFLEVRVLDSHSIFYGLKAGFGLFTVLSLIGLGISKFLFIRYFISKNNRSRAIIAASLILMAISIFSLMRILIGGEYSESDWLKIYIASSLVQALISPALLMSILDGIDYENWSKVIRTFYALSYLGVILAAIVSSILSPMTFITAMTVLSSILLISSHRLTSSSPLVSFASLKLISIFADELDSILKNRSSQRIFRSYFYREIIKYSLLVAVVASLRLITLSELEVDERNIAMIYFSIGSLLGCMLIVESAGFIIAYILVVIYGLMKYCELEFNILVPSLLYLILLGASLMLAQLSLFNFILDNKPRELLRSLSITSLLTMLSSFLLSYLMLLGELLFMIMGIILLPIAGLLVGSAIARLHREEWYDDAGGGI